MAIIEHNGKLYEQSKWNAKYKRIDDYSNTYDDLIEVKLNLDYDDNMKLHEWCAKNLNGYWLFFSRERVYLTDKEDALRFKLTWS